MTIPFPIPREDFDHCIELLKALEISRVSARDRHVDEISSGWPILGRLEGTNVDLDGTETAILLIDGGGGRVIRYGVVYDNGMKLDQSYDGRTFLHTSMSRLRRRLQTMERYFFFSSIKTGASLFAQP